MTYNKYTLPYTDTIDFTIEEKSSYTSSNITIAGQSKSLMKEIVIIITRSIKRPKLLKFHMLHLRYPSISYRLDNTDCLKADHYIHYFGKTIKKWQAMGQEGIRRNNSIINMPQPCESAWSYLKFNEPEVKGHSDTGTAWKESRVLPERNWSMSKTNTGELGIEIGWAISGQSITYYPGTWWHWLTIDCKNVTSIWSLIFIFVSHTCIAGSQSVNVHIFHKSDPTEKEVQCTEFCVHIICMIYSLQPSSLHHSAEIPWAEHRR